MSLKMKTTFVCNTKNTFEVKKKWSSNLCIHNVPRHLRSSISTNVLRIAFHTFCIDFPEELVLYKELSLEVSSFFNPMTPLCHFVKEFRSYH